MDDKDTPMAERGKRIARREFLKVAVGAGGAVLLAGCTSAPPASPTSAPAPPAATAASGAPAAASAPGAAAAPTAAPAAKVGTETIRIVVGVDPDTLDPNGQTTTTVMNMMDYMMESLVSLGEDGKPHPALAESWEMTPDGKSYTFKLRKDVTFHDGAPFNAQAVKLTWDRILNPDFKVPLRSPMDVVDSVTPVDDFTVKFNLKNPFAPFIAAMTGTQYSIISPATAKGFPTSNTEQPIGTGPYTFKSRTKGSEMVLTRNDKYWGRKPYYQNVQFRIVPEAATRESLLLANQADMILLPPVSDIPRLQTNNQVKVLLAGSNRTIFIAIDCTRPGPTKEVKFRQALNYAVDKPGIIKSILFGAAEQMDAPMSPKMFGYSKQTPYAYDPAKAKQLLQEGGWTNVTLKMYYPTGRYLQDAPACQAIIGNLRDVGINVEASTMDWPTFQGLVQVPPEKATADIHMIGWAPFYLDAAQAMAQFQKSQWAPAGLATTHYTNPTVEDLLDKAFRNPNEQERLQQYAQASKIVWDEAPWIFGWVQSFPIVHSVKVKGVGALGNEKFSAIYAEPA